MPLHCKYAIICVPCAESDQGPCLWLDDTPPHTPCSSWGHHSETPSHSQDAALNCSVPTWWRSPHHPPPPGPWCTTYTCPSWSPVHTDTESWVRSYSWGVWEYSVYDKTLSIGVMMSKDRLYQKQQSRLCSRSNSRSVTAHSFQVSYMICL